MLLEKRMSNLCGCECKMRKREKEKQETHQPHISQPYMTSFQGVSKVKTTWTCSVTGWDVEKKKRGMAVDASPLMKTSLDTPINVIVRDVKAAAPMAHHPCVCVCVNKLIAFTDKHGIVSKMVYDTPTAGII